MRPFHALLVFAHWTYILTEPVQEIPEMRKGISVLNNPKNRKILQNEIVRLGVNLLELVD